MAKNKLGLETDAETSARLGRVRQKGTTPELAVRRAARRLGAHYRTENRDLWGSPDLANRARKWAVFVHGCFWHRHEGCRKATTPTRNRDFWVAKLTRNVERDSQAIAALEDAGYAVLVVWECETTGEARLEGRLAPFFAKVNAPAASREA